MILGRSVVGQRIPFYLVDATDGVTPETAITFTPQYSKNGLAFVNFINTRVEIGSGWYYLEATATEINTDGIFIVRAAATGVRTFNAEHHVRSLIQSTDILDQVNAALAEIQVEPTGLWTPTRSLAGAIMDTRQWLHASHDSTQLTTTTGQVVMKLDNGTARFKKTYSRVGNVFTVNKPIAP